MNKDVHILVVDDEPLNIEIVTELLFDQPYKVSTAADGLIAWQMLERSPDDFDVILLDRMMPNMNGMEVMEKISAHSVLKHCPVIFQTAKANSSDMLEGLKAGAHYYLTKPFNEDILLSVVQTAVRDRLSFKGMQASLSSTNALMGLLESATFNFRTLDEARSLAALLSKACPNSDAIVMGLTELTLNAIEHGNLGITYDEKTLLNDNGNWEQEVEERLKKPDNINKSASIHFQLKDNTIEITIKDQGDGFNWQTYMDFDPDRIMDNHGRGIAVANKLSFTDVEYRGNGNEVCAKLVMK